MSRKSTSPSRSSTYGKVDPSTQVKKPKHKNTRGNYELLKPAQDEYRRRMQTGKIINRLQNFVLADLEMEPEKNMTTQQVTAALGLLKKTLPDLQAMSFEDTTDKPKQVDLVDIDLSDYRVIDNAVNKMEAIMNLNEVDSDQSESQADSLPSKE